MQATRNNRTDHITKHIVRYRDYTGSSQAHISTALLHQICRTENSSWNDSTQTNPDRLNNGADFAVKSNNKQSMKHDNRHITRSRSRPSKSQLQGQYTQKDPYLSSRDDKVTQMK